MEAFRTRFFRRRSACARHPLLGGTRPTYCSRSHQRSSRRRRARAGSDLPAGKSAEPGGNQGQGHRRLARGQGTAAGTRHRGRGRNGSTRRSAPRVTDRTATGSALHRGLIPLGNAKPVKIPFSLVPYATTVWDFINRAMPPDHAGLAHAGRGLRGDRVTCSYRNDVVKETDVLDADEPPEGTECRIATISCLHNRNGNPKAKRPFGYYP